jgi:hypothetical protein
VQVVVRQREATPARPLPAPLIERRAVTQKPARTMAATSRSPAAPAAASRFTEAQLAAVQERLSEAVSDAKPADPLSVPSEPPAAPRRYAMDLTGTPGSLVRGQGILRPLRSWSQDGYVYYYVSYEITYSDGTYDSGAVPWPIRYLPADDPFTRPPHIIPLPPPLPDFVLPPGTRLGRALRPYFPGGETSGTAD